MAVLCRLHGIPARIVTGFAPGSYSLVENAYIYKASDAHAWVEVYFDGYGWIMFDPSPTSRDVFNKSDLIRMVTGVTDFLSQLFVLDPAATQKMLVESLTRLWKSIISYGPSAVLFITMSLFLLLLGVYVTRLQRGGRDQKLTPENAVIASYLTVRDELARLGLAQEEGQTARAYLTEVPAHAEPLRSALIEFVPLYERAAFAPHLALQEPDAPAGLVGKVRQYVRDELTQRRKMRGRAGD
jgi:hypothetical protein